MEKKESLLQKEYKNWKSGIAFFSFLFIYWYSVFSDKSDIMVWNTGILAVIVTISIMARSEKAMDLLTSLINKKK